MAERITFEKPDHTVGRVTVTGDRLDVNAIIDSGTITLIEQSRIYGKTGDSTYQVPRLDYTTHILKAISPTEAAINEGNHYYIEGFTTLADTETLYVKLVTPDSGVWSHFRWSITSNGILESYFYEAVSGGMTGGSGVTPLNNNRNSVNASGLVITKGVTVAENLGTTISQFKVGGTGFKSAVGGTSTLTDKIVLKQNTIYQRKFLSGTADNIVSFRASWIEHTNKAA